MVGKKIVRKGAKYKRAYKTPGKWYKPKGYRQTNKSNNNYKSGVSNYRARAIARDGATCRTCGKKKSKSQLEVNHLDTQGKRRDSKNHSNANLRTVCKSCHRRYHQGRGKSKAPVKSGYKKK